MCGFFVWCAGLEEQREAASGGQRQGRHLLLHLAGARPRGERGLARGDDTAGEILASLRRALRFYLGDTCSVRTECRLLFFSSPAIISFHCNVMLYEVRLLWQVSLCQEKKRQQIRTFAMETEYELGSFFSL